MTAMPDLSGRYRIALGAGWVLLAAAGVIYARLKVIPLATALPIIAAFLVEFAFYLLPGFPDLLHTWVKRMGSLGTVAFLTMSSILPYLIYSVPLRSFDTRSLLQVAAIALVVSLIYARGRVNGARDAVFIVLLAAFVLYRFFDRIYLSPIPKLQISILGHLMLIRTAALSVFGLRGGVAARFWFLPSLEEWGIGLKWFGLSLVPLAAAGWASGAIRLRDSPLNPLTAVVTFLGILWVVALSEEFFFRGLIQQWIEDWTSRTSHTLRSESRLRASVAGESACPTSADEIHSVNLQSQVGQALSPAAMPVRTGEKYALIIASLLFGSVHLGFHGAFPNWRFSLVAAVLGLFCGLAWRERRSIQSSMVTHALAATAFRVFFQ